MADFGDDAGDVLLRETNSFIQRWLQSRTRTVRRITEPRQRNEANQEAAAAPLPTGSGHGHCSVLIDDAAQAERIARSLESAGIPYEVHRAALDLSTKAQGGETVFSLSERVEITFSEKDYDAVRDIVSRGVREPMERASYVQEIEVIVHDALSKTQDPQQFISLCREKGLDVGYASDGMLKFTHPNGWFEVRADTLSERMENGLDREAFERGVGEKAEDLSQHAVEEQERYIQSHDSQDTDVSTRVVEHPEKLKERKPKQEYDLQSEKRDMCAASQPRDMDMGRGVKEISPQER